jgi:PAS domain S-box-containing protein
VRESEERFRKIFESNPDPVILAKLEDGAIIDVNKAFEVVTGVARHKAAVNSLEELGLWTNQSSREPFRKILQDYGEVTNYETDFRVKDGPIKTGLVSASIFRLSKESCILLVIRDITTEKAAEQALVEMDRMKSEFISTAAHELNTPLSAMMGYAEFLHTPEEFGGFTEVQINDFIKEIYENGEALSRTIEDLLDISRIESGKPIPLVLQKTDFMKVLSNRLKSFMTHDLGHTYRLDLPSKTVQSKLLFDRHRINQALDNLLSNAMKYSPEGKDIVLKAREGKDGWEIRVEDQGLGMNAEQLNRIFDKFYRADASDTSISGLGLGMSIVKQIVEAHGGSLRVESVEGKGTTAIFTLPYDSEMTNLSQQ